MFPDDANWSADPEVARELALFTDTCFVDISEDEVDRAISDLTFQGDVETFVRTLSVGCSRLLHLFVLESPEISAYDTSDALAEMVLSRMWYRSELIPFAKAVLRMDLDGRTRGKLPAELRELVDDSSSAKKLVHAHVMIAAGMSAMHADSYGLENDGDSLRYVLAVN